MSINDFKRLLQELVVPDIQAIKASVSKIEVEIRRLDERIDNLDKRLGERIDSLDKRLGEKIASLDKRIDGLDKRIDSVDRRMISLEQRFDATISLHERIAAIEAKLSLH